MQRREFIKQSCTGCLGLLGAGALLSTLQSCAPLPVFRSQPDNGVISVPESSFTPEKPILMVRTPSLDYDILLVKKADGSYNALYMQCTHQNQPLTANKKGLFCPAHGSAFDLDGRVTQAPADKALISYKTSIEQNTVKIHLTPKS